MVGKELGLKLVFRVLELFYRYYVRFFVGGKGVMSFFKSWGFF